MLLRRRFPLALNLLSQIFFQRYNSNLPTSLTNFLPSTRGFSPWVPDAVVGTTRWRGARGTSIFQDAVGGSDENDRYFRFSGISRRSPSELIALLEKGAQKANRERTPKRRRVGNGGRGGIRKLLPSLLSFPRTFPSQKLPLSRKENSSQTPSACLEVSFRRRQCAAISVHPAPGARILTSFSFIGIKNRRANSVFSFNLADFFLLTVFQSQFRIDSLLSHQNSQQTLTHFSPHGSNKKHSHMCICY